MSSLLGIEDAVAAVTEGASENVWVAASEGKMAELRAHIEGGKVSATSTDENGYTPLHAAASYSQEEALRYLIASLGGRSVDVADGDGDTPLHACESEGCGQQLLDAGANIEARNHEGKTPIEVAREDERAALSAWLVAQLRMRGLEVPPEPEEDEEEEGEEGSAASASASSSSSSSSEWAGMGWIE